MVQANDFRQPDPVADPVLNEATVLRFVRLHLPSASAVTAVDETGGEARTYAIDEDYIFKTQRPHRIRVGCSQEKEAFFLNRLAREMPEISVPDVLGYGKEGSIEYTLMTRMPGIAVRNVALEADTRWSALLDLGRALRRIHSLDLAPFELSGLFPSDEDGLAVRKRIESSLRRSGTAIAAQPDLWPLALDADAAVARTLQSIQDESRVVLHSNPGPEHVFVDPVTLQFQGIIDFGDAYISHPAFDLRRWRAADLTALIQGYSSEAAVDNAFLATWRAVVISGLMATIAGQGPGARPDRRQAALEDLSSVLEEFA